MRACGSADCYSAVCVGVRVSGTDSTVNCGLGAVQIGTALFVKAVRVFRTDSTLKCGLAAVQIGTALFVWVCECLEMTVW